MQKERCHQLQFWEHMYELDVKSYIQNSNLKTFNSLTGEQLTVNTLCSLLFKKNIFLCYINVRFYYVVSRVHEGAVMKYLRLSKKSLLRI